MNWSVPNGDELELSSLRLGSRVASVMTPRRWSIVLGALLLVVCAVAITGTVRMDSAITNVQRASNLSDLYQDARYFAAQEDAELTTYRVDRTPEALNAHNTAAASLDTTLRTIISGSSTSAQDRASASGILALHQHYQALTAKEFELLGADRNSAAAQFENTQIAPILDRFTKDLGTLEEAHRQTTIAQLNAATRDGKILDVGTPTGLGLTLSLLLAFTLVTRRYRRDAERQALHDALTELPNRLLFADRVEHAVAGAERSGAVPTVMLLDLDRFKQVNDTLGHHYGDQLLIDVARRIRDELRPTDTVARLGGDEFAVLLPDGGAEAGTQAANRILHNFEQPFTLAGITVGIEASIGIAAAGVDSEPDSRVTETSSQDARMPDLLKRADTAMYEAKKDRSGFRHFAPGQASATTAHLTLLGELRQAFDRDELVLHYQPKVAVDTGEFIGVEALVRWQHPTRGLLAPDEFIGLAETTTLIHRLTGIVLDKALALSREWLDRGTEVPVAVNVSARTLLDHNFAATVIDRLDTANVPPRLLCIELTESAIMSDPDGALAVLRKLHDMGVRLSVDDFGTGYSSMAYLKILPVDELKVDRSFVKDMTTNASDSVLVQSAIDLGHNLGLSVVAEGVEDDTTLSALKIAGADIVQGFYLGRPMTQDLLELWLTNRARPLDPTQPLVAG
jgi:diguanylate cyclase (GGDEF)-like protein